MVNPLRQLSYALPMGYDLPCRTNSDYGEEWYFEVDNEPVDLTSNVFRMEIKSSPESLTILHSFIMVSSSAAEGLYIADPLSGVVQLRMDWETLRGVFSTVYPDDYYCGEMTLFYDLVCTNSDGFRQAWLCGFVRLNKGITYG